LPIALRKENIIVFHMLIKLIRRKIRILSGIYLYFFGSRFAIRELKKQLKGYGKNVQSLVDISFNFEYSQRLRKSWIINIRPLQVKSEVTEFFRIVQELNPKIIVEIGTASGGTLFLSANVADPEKIVSIDLPYGSFGGGYSSWKIPFYKSLARKSVIKLIRADSHLQSTLEETKKELKNRPVDILFIDGDHTYEGIAKDFQMYSPLVKKGGIVAFHDIVVHDKSSGCEVSEFWNKIKKSYRHQEIIENLNQKWAGIGILFF
jgi:cephalosporin hydroxylase